MQQGKSLLRSTRSLSWCPDNTLPDAGPRLQSRRQTATLGTRPVSIYSEARRPPPDKLDHFMHRSTRKHLSNNEARLVDCIVVPHVQNALYSWRKVRAL